MLKAVCYTMSPTSMKNTKENNVFIYNVTMYI